MEALARAVRAKSEDHLPFYAIGHCFSGIMVAKLGQSPSPLVDAWASVHPSRPKLTELQNIIAPGMFALSEFDFAISKSVAEKMAKALPAARQVWYMGVTHGFAVRGPPTATFDAAREKCVADCSAFFLEHGKFEK